MRARMLEVDWREMTRMIRNGFGLLLCLLVIVGIGFAQIKSSTITGTVTDQNGAVVADATITITNTNTGVTTGAKSNADGVYTVPYLEQGLYTVTVRAAGFETFKKTGITLTSGVKVEVNAPLPIGTVSQTVEVAASTAELQTETASVQGSVDTQIIMNIPNINDNPVYYATLQSGVVPSLEMYDNEALGVGFQNRQEMSGMNINGGQAGDGDVQIDGLSVQGAAWHDSSELPNRDALQEVSITTNALSAELGGGLGVVQMTTKSGTNDFHGDLAYRMRNEAFNANGTANDIQGIAKQKYRLNEESGAIGGPVRIPHVWDGRNKVFFFVSFARDSHPTTSSGFQTVPTALERTGDFSASFMPGYGNTPIPARIFNPYEAAAVAGTGNPAQVYQRPEYPKGPNGAGDMIPNPNAGGLTIMNAYPLPNYAGNGQSLSAGGGIDPYHTNNFFYSGGSSTVRDNFSLRVDAHLVPKNSFYGTFGKQDGSTSIINDWASGAPAQSGYKPAICCDSNYADAFNDKNYFVAIGDTITINSSTIVDVRYGVNRIETTTGVPRSGAQTGFTSADYLKWGMPASVQAFIAIPGASPTILQPGDNYSPENWDVWANKNEHQTNHALIGSVTKLLGKWTLKAGAEDHIYLGNWRDLKFGTPAMLPTFHDSNVEEFGGISGGGSSYNTDPSMNGDGNARTLVGAQGWDLDSGVTSKPALAAKYLAFYTQDDWKVNHKLTVNLGLRYEIQPGPTERHNQAGSLDLNAVNPYAAQGIGAANPSSMAGLGFFVFPGQSGYSRNLWETKFNNFSPRVGISYEIGDSGVLRIGAGRVYIPSNTGFNANTTIYGTNGFAGGTVAAAYGNGPYNGLPAGSEALGFEDPAQTQLRPSAGAVQAPGVYGGFGDPGLFVRDHRNGFLDEWNISYERQIHGWLATAAYVGSKGEHLPWRDQAINGQFDIPWGTLSDWQNTWIATNGGTDPAQVQVPNPLPALVGGAQGPIGSGTISTINSQMPYLAWLNGFKVGDTGTSLYHSLQIKAQHSYSNGLSALFSYTYSRSQGLQGGTIGNGAGGTSYAESQLGSSQTPLGGNDYRNIHNNYGLLNYDIPNRFVGVVSYLLPTGRGQRFDPGNSIARAIIGEWNLSSVVTVQSGQPWGPNCGQTGGGSAENGRCYATGQPLKLPKSYQRWYDGNTQVTLPDGRRFTPGANTKLIWNPDAFTSQLVQWANGQYQQAQYWEGSTKMVMDQLRMPALENVNLTVSRKFPIRERMNFEILAEATNAFNHGNFYSNAVNNGFGSVFINADPSTNSTIGQNSNSSAGAVTPSFLPPREMTLSARFTF